MTGHGNGKIALLSEPLWYRTAVIYQLHVRSFMDSNGDGVGDFPGLTGRLDYLQDLGVTAIWLLPFYPSPLKDDGYDIADYTDVNPAYGTLRDFRRFVSEAHRRGLRVITELVINHTSDQHAWFQRARRSPRGSRQRDFYVWSDDPSKYSGTRIIFQDFEHSNWAWDAVAGQYYWHRFYSHQPDLNFDNPAVHKAIEGIATHWFEMGVDGVRLDAIPYLYEREGTNCENLPETHAYLKQLRRYVQGRWPDAMLLAEANQWPEEAVHYFGQGDECHMAFHFPLMPRLFMGIQQEDRFPIVDILQQTPALPPPCQWAIFLRNHDELTLEMVTDEERDYMYRVYAQDRQARINLGIRRRLAPLMGNNRRKMELMKGLLCSLPGTPVLYYGDEIGMGDNVYLGDRNGVRTPMQWSSDRNAGFSRANPQSLVLPPIIDPEYHYEKINVESQQGNPSSLLWWMKRLIALRKRHPVLGTGALEFLHPSNPKVLAFLRRDEREGPGGEQTVLVVANLSRFVQPAEIDLSAFRGYRPVELFGRTAFPPVGESAYFLTLGPHSFYWFALEPVRSAAGELAPTTGTAAAEGVGGAGGPVGVGGRQVPIVSIREPADRLLRSVRSLSLLEGLLAADIAERRWFGGKAGTIRSFRIVDVAPLKTDVPERELAACLAVVRVEYTEGEGETYAIPLAVATPAHAAGVEAVGSGMGSDGPGGGGPGSIAQLRTAGKDEWWILYDAMTDPACCRALYELIYRRRRIKSEAGELIGTAAQALRRGDTGASPGMEVSPARADQSNSSVTFGDRYIMKLFRRVEAGPNPDLEVGRYLSERVGFPHTPALAGWIEYAGAGGGGGGGGRPERASLAMLQVYVPNQGDAWRYTLDQLGQFYERMLASSCVPLNNGQAPVSLPAPGVVLRLANEPTPESVAAFIGPYLHSAELLGQRTAEMHAALASPTDDPAFAPEPFSQLYQRSIYQSMRNSARRSLQLLRRRAGDFPEALRPDLERVLTHEDELVGRLRTVTSRPMRLMRIRCHGDYHLGQVLYTGKDFVIIDFEGEPARPLGERRLKRSSLRDVAGMLRSFQYAAFAALFQQVQRGLIPSGEEHLSAAEPCAQAWCTHVSAVFLRAYLAAAAAGGAAGGGGGAAFLPETAEETRLLLEAFLLEKALYELTYELNNRPAWTRIPLRGIATLLEAGSTVSSVGG